MGVLSGYAQRQAVDVDVVVEIPFVLAPSPLK